MINYLDNSISEAQVKIDALKVLEINPTRDHYRRATREFVDPTERSDALYMMLAHETPLSSLIEQLRAKMTTWEQRYRYMIILRENLPDSAFIDTPIGLPEARNFSLATDWLVINAPAEDHLRAGMQALTERKEP